MTIDTHTIAATVHGRFLVRAGPPERLLIGFHGYAETAETHMHELLKIGGVDEWTVVAVQALHPFYTARTQQIVASWMTKLDRGPDFVGFWDADLATPLSELPGFMKVMKTRPQIEMVLGARVRLLGRDIRRNPTRHYVGRVGATLISSSLGLAVYDTQCGAKLFRANDTLRDVFGTPFLSRWIFDV